jgi:amino acid permease
MFKHSTDDTVVTTTINEPDVESSPIIPPQDGSPVRHIVEEREDKDLARALKQRHIQMIALAGAIVSDEFPISLSLNPSL